MKAILIQPPYSADPSRADELFEYKLAELDKCGPDADVVVLPEYCDVPCAASTREETLKFHDEYFDRLMKKCVATAKRCSCLVFVNALDKVGNNYANTTFAIDKNGETVGRYRKMHLPHAESKKKALEYAYTFGHDEPYIITVDGVRYGFMTCYDFYFYEAFSRLARYKVDVIIGCSHQRSDTHEATEIMCRFLAYQTNAYVLRSCVSFDEASGVCGGTMAVSPDGEVLANMKSLFGSAAVTFDPKSKYYKPAGYGNPDSAHWEYIEKGRRPWQYRPAGSAIVPSDAELSYPRLCAHRGFSAVAPENTMPAFGAAVGMGADEIEFDLWKSKDNKWVSVHTYKLENVSDGHGNVWDCTLDELKKLDFGSYYSPHFRGLRIQTFEEILERFACHTVMNVHIKSFEEEFGREEEIYDDGMLDELIRLIDKYDCREHVYIMTVSESLHRRLASKAPYLCRCMGNAPAYGDIIDRALRTGCRKVQLFKGYFDENTVKRAKENGLICNVFWSDDPDEAEKYLAMGVDTILTNEYAALRDAAANFKLKIGN